MSFAHSSFDGECVHEMEEWVDNSIIIHNFFRWSGEENSHKYSISNSSAG